MLKDYIKHTKKYKGQIRAATNLILRLIQKFIKHLYDYKNANALTDFMEEEFHLKGLTHSFQRNWQISVLILFADASFIEINRAFQLRILDGQ